MAKTCSCHEMGSSEARTGAWADQDGRRKGWGGATVRERATVGEVDWEIACVAGGSGGGETRLERFGDLHDIDIMLPTIDWVGNLRIPN